MQGDIRYLPLSALHETSWIDLCLFGTAFTSPWDSTREPISLIMCDLIATLLGSDS